MYMLNINETTFVHTSEEGLVRKIAKSSIGTIFFKASPFSHSNLDNKIFDLNEVNFHALSTKQVIYFDLYDETIASLRQLGFDLSLKERIFSRPSSTPYFRFEKTNSKNALFFPEIIPLSNVLFFFERISSQLKSLVKFEFISDILKAGSLKPENYPYVSWPDKSAPLILSLPHFITNSIRYVNLGSLLEELLHLTTHQGILTSSNYNLDAKKFNILLNSDPARHMAVLQHALYMQHPFCTKPLFLQNSGQFIDISQLFELGWLSTLKDKFFIHPRVHLNSIVSTSPYPSLTPRPLIKGYVHDDRISRIVLENLDYEMFKSAKTIL